MPWLMIVLGNHEDAFGRLDCLFILISLKIIGLTVMLFLWSTPLYWLSDTVALKLDIV